MKQHRYYLCAILLLLSSCSQEDLRYYDPKNPTTQQSIKPSAAPVMAEEATPDVIGKIPDDATPIKVGILLPLSGDSAPVGNAMLDAAMLALSDEYMAVPSREIRSQIVLLPRDTENSTNTTVAAAQQAIDQGASFIVGPLFGQTVTAIKPILQPKNIPALSFSNNQTVASPNIYTFGFLPEQQINRIAEYAYLNNFTRVAVIAPNDPYGQKIRDELTNTYIKKGGTAAPIEFYAPSAANIDAAVARMMAAYNNMAADRRFQAIFIGDSGANLKNIIAAFKKNNVDLTKIKLLGTGFWDDPAITEITELHGAWFPSSPPKPYAVFKKRFTTTYGYEPTRLASLSYDAVSLIAQISMHNDAATINSALLPKKEGYIGAANGLFRLKESGISERRLAIMEVTPNGFKVLEQALKSFPPEEQK